MSSRASRKRTIVLPAVAIDPSARPARRVICRAGVVMARRSERPALSVDKFRYFVDSTGRQHFNFVQQIWLLPQVEMAVTPVMTVALETLAVNLLTLVSRRRDQPAAVGVTSKTVLELAPRFCKECLMTALPDGWVIPRASVRSWLAAHARAAASASVRRRPARGPR